MKTKQIRLLGAVGLAIAVMALLAILATSNSNNSNNASKSGTANTDQVLAKESDYINFDACAVLRQAVGVVFPSETLTEKSPYKNFSETGEWTNGCTLEGADPYKFSSLVTVRTYSDKDRASKSVAPVNELPNGTGLGKGRISSRGEGSTLQDASIYGYESTMMRYAKDGHYIELTLGGVAGVRDKVEQVSVELDKLIPAIQ